VLYAAVVHVPSKRGVYSPPTPRSPGNPWVVIAGIVIAVIGAVIGFCVWAFLKMKPAYLRVQAEVLQLVGFSIEMREPGGPEKPRDEPRS
jgi:hypothetical protein